VPLEPASAITGVVSTPAGSPAAGAAVAMLGGSMRVQMQSPARFLDYGPDPRQHRTRTATDGSFRLSSRREGTRIIVIHDTGFANLPLESAREGDIVLQPWGRIEGVIKVGSQPGANLELSAQATPGYPDGLAFYYRAKSDAAGRFVFEKVPTGQVDVSRSMLTPFSRDGTGLTASTQLRTVAVAAGQTTQVSLGGAGVQVRGRLVLQTPRPDAAIEQAAQNLRPANQVPDPTAVPRGYGFFCQPDGTFVIEDVPPGEYVLELRVNAVKDRNNPDSAFGFPIAKLDTPITIPENQTEPFDLGQFKVPPLR
jgi:hypothetical protein